MYAVVTSRALFRPTRTICNVAKRSVSTSSLIRYPRTAPRAISSGGFQSTQFTSNDNLHRQEETEPFSKDGKPWYLQDGPVKEQRPSSSNSLPKQDIVSILEPHLLPLYNSLIESPLYITDQIQVIDMRKDTQSWVNWIFILTLREGRERSLTAATNAMADSLRNEVTWPEGKEPVAINVEGTNSHDPIWGLVDAESIAVHVMTPEAREMYQIEQAAHRSLSAADDAFHPSMLQ